MTHTELETFLDRSTLRAAQAHALESHAELHIDTHHPFFFDHPLDHVPGLLLLSSMADLAWQCMAGDDASRASGLYNPSMQARFSKWCLFTPEVHLQARGSLTLPSIVDVAARQEGVLRCESHVKIDTAPVRRAYPLGLRSVAPCEKHLVNKHDIANVMVGAPAVDGDDLRAQVITPAPGHVLQGPDAELLGTLYLLEAFMQTQRLLNKLAVGEAGHRLRDTLCEVSIDLQRPVGRTEAVDILRSTTATPVCRGLRRHEGLLTVEGETVGQCAILTLTSP